MLSGQADRLRDMADVFDAAGIHANIARELRDAADTILQLRDDLQRANAENDRLRKERDTLLMNATPTASELRRVRAAWKEDRNENAKLLERVHALELENIRLTSDNCDLRGEIEPTFSENAKLRELVRAAYNCTNAGPSCLACRIVAGGCTLLSAMRELGLEMDG